MEPGNYWRNSQTNSWRNYWKNLWRNSCRNSRKIARGIHEDTAGVMLNNVEKDYPVLFIEEKVPAKLFEEKVIRDRVKWITAIHRISRNAHKPTCFERKHSWYSLWGFLREYFTWIFLELLKHSLNLSSSKNLPTVDCFLKVLFSKKSSEILQGTCPRFIQVIANPFLISEICYVSLWILWKFFHVFIPSL